MPYKRRIAAAILCACFLLRLTSYAVSRDGLYFVAVENMVAPLTEETMPFWHDDYLYISSDVFTGAVRDALGVGRAKIGDGVLLYRGEQSLLFRNDYPYAQDSQEETYSPGMVWHEGSAYVPASVVARYFNLTYSTVEVRYGKLVWLRSASFKMDDKAFAKAAEFQLNSAYQEYLRSLEPEPDAPEDVPEAAEPDAEAVEPETPQAVGPEAPETTTNPVEPDATTTKPVTPTPTKPVTPADPETPMTPSASDATSKPVKQETPTTTKPAAPSVTEPAAPSEAATPVTAAETPPDSAPEIVGGQRIYICLRGGDAASALLDALDRHSLRAAVFCDETFLSEQGDLSRRIAATGHAIGLYVRADSAASALERLEACNERLRLVTMEKTRLVYAEGAGPSTLRALRDAGFLCLRPTLDRTQFPLRTSRQADDLLKAVSRQSETVTLWLGGAVSRSALNAFVNDALEVGDAFPTLNETVLY